MTSEKDKRDNESETDELKVILGNVDWQLLRKQKLQLIRLADSHDENLMGVVHLLDQIQDSVAEIIGEETVFGNASR